MSPAVPLLEAEPVVSEADEGELLATFRRVGPAMWRQALAVLGERQAAEDAVQEAFLRVWRRRERLRAGELDAYLVRAARNLALDMHRYRSRRAALGSEADPEQVALVVPRRPDAQEESERLSRALHALPLEQREVVLLRVVEGLTAPQVAARTGVPEGTVSSRLRYGLNRLRQLLGPTDAPEARP